MDTGFRDEVMAVLPGLRGYAMILTRSANDADDLIQDVLLRAWKYRDGYQPGTNLKAWLFRILRNEFLSHAKRNARISWSLDAGNLPEPGREPEQDWQRLYKELLRGLDQLPLNLREAILLVGAAGFSYDEAADACGCAVGTVKSRVSRARERLAAMVDYDLPVRRRLLRQPPPPPAAALAAYSVTRAL